MAYEQSLIDYDSSVIACSERLSCIHSSGICVECKYTGDPIGVDNLSPLI